MKILRYTFKDRSQSRTTTLILNEIKKKKIIPLILQHGRNNYTPTNDKILRNLNAIAEQHTHTHTHTGTISSRTYTRVYTRSRIDLAEK